MSFIPAEEDSGDEYEDGFFDEDNYSCKIGKTLPITVKPKPHLEISVQSQIIEKNKNNYSSEPQNSSPIRLLLQHKKYTFPLKRSLPDHENFIAMHSSEMNVYTTEDLQKAVVRGNLSVVEECISQGLPFDTPYKGGWTALMYAANYAQQNIVNYLVNLGANVNYNYDFFTPLMAACSAVGVNEDDVTQCVNILLNAGADINAQDRCHVTALMLASKEGHCETIQLLIKHGAEVNKQDGRGWTPLSWSVQRGKKEVVQVLLSLGAEATMKHQDGLSIIQLAANLPTNEILEILEKSSFSKEYKSESTVSSVILQDEDPKCDDLKVFLLGLNLPHLVALFQQQLIDLSFLMTLTDDDLIKIGVNQLGARKKILDAVNAIHKKDWQPSSLIPFHQNKKLSCGDVIAIMANISSHMRYIGSTIFFIRQKLKQHPNIMMHPTEQASPLLLSRHIDDTLAVMKTLNSQVLNLQVELDKEIKVRNVQSADLLEKNSVKEKKHLAHVIIVFTLCSCIAVPLYCFRNTLLSNIPQNKFSYLLSGSS